MAALRPAPAPAITPFFKPLTPISSIVLFAVIMPQIVRSMAILFRDVGMLAIVALRLRRAGLPADAGPSIAAPRGTGLPIQLPQRYRVDVQNPAVGASVVTYLIVQFVAGTLAGELFWRQTRIEGVANAADISGLIQCTGRLRINLEDPGCTQTGYATFLGALFAKANNDRALGNAYGRVRVWWPARSSKPLRPGQLGW